MEDYLEEDTITEPSIHFEEFYDKHKRDDILEKESKGTYLLWNELSDHNLVAAI